jgi:UDP-glucose-4-epimerase GalE
MRKVIVTGGCGYIGSHVARAFKQHGDQVILIDRVYRQHTMKGIDGYVHNDFASSVGLSAIVMHEPDIIVHCAGTSLVGPSIENPAEYYDNNVSKTITMLNVIKDMPKKPVILFSSSASVYGVPERLPIDEQCAIKPISPYGRTKGMIESILRDYSFAYDITSMCFRYFNAAGAEPFNSDLGQEPGATHIIARALEASIAQKAFMINGNNFNTSDGTCVRDYIHVWDLAIAHIQAASYLLDDYPQAGAHIVNLGTNSGISNKEIASYIKQKYGLLDIQYAGRRAGDPDTLIADARAAKELLLWQPEYSDIQTIIDSAYRWYTRGV